MNTTADSTRYTREDQAASGLLGLAERGTLPDALIRAGIRRLCAKRLAEEGEGGLTTVAARYQSRIDALRRSAVAVHTDAANGQHYELPPRFFELCLGPRLKYSGCLYPTGAETLAQAEDAMLDVYGRRAELADGQTILELGCGWGSLTLWMARRFPNARITAVSNSQGQRRHIEARCVELGLDNVRVITADVNALELPAGGFDRCVSVEMFEHMRNYETLLSRIGTWLRPGGKLFVHIFAHRQFMYPFETDGEDDWMGRHFFTGGLMPASDTLLWFQQDLKIEDRWHVDGSHYERTANHWLANQDAARDEVMAVLREAYGDAAGLWFQRWRIFWMSCAELFGYANGQEWLVAHYRFARS
ncbi:cyclopropane-fatty-acyl-phospholipid synthase family protein [Luteibacter sp. 22Crub2.1]|uniref:SAM-dependent methyltransferase n=1 Tax=Luteibacter sp. 22Crub2.1 TaxID=1283288 RepID=UPI0009A5F409|nr:cyclopropane-fatty-acyl-phospholipid synthase family protein [Luteibacter sp. 22Crub2.1]SKB60375.1 cyclopropane-fatty-acyl-phospholipid synthase [Luteibacter sp. 22Crub2.1]